MATRQRYPSVLTPDIFQEGAAPPRGFFNQLGMVIFQPGAFFQTLPLTFRSRSWLWAAILILIMVSFSAIQRSTGADAAGEVAAPLPAMDMGVEPGMPPAGQSSVTLPPLGPGTAYNGQMQVAVGLDVEDGPARIPLALTYQDITGERFTTIAELSVTVRNVETNSQIVVDAYTVETPETQSH